MQVRKAIISDIDYIFHNFHNAKNLSESQIINYKNIIRDTLNEENSDIFIVIHKTEEVGLFMLNYKRDIKTLGKIASISAISLNESAKMEGVGKDILEWVEVFSKETGIEKVEVLTGENNKIHEFYTEHGYTNGGYLFSKDLLKSNSYTI